ncbi:MAG: hypothetical protein R3A44_35795 [Caldilineaceae bacterium]
MSDAKEERKAKLRRLRGLAMSPDKQAEYAVELLQEVNDAKRGKLIGERETIQAALRVLANHPTEAARDVLMTVYARFAENGPLYDAGAYARSLILAALRPTLFQADLPLMIAAVETYEFPPPQFKEEAAPLRATALVAINELDDFVARFHATRLLADEHTDRMSGEPALSAIRVLGSQGELLPLYYYVMQPTTQTLPELVAESLRLLTNLPAALLPALQARYAESPHDVVLAGLFDLLLDHEAGPHDEEFLMGFLRKTNRHDAYQYLITAIVSRAATGRELFLAALLAYAEHEHKHEKAIMLVDTLSILSHNAEIAALLRKLELR